MGGGREDARVKLDCRVVSGSTNSIAIRCDHTALGSSSGFSTRTMRPARLRSASSGDTRKLTVTTSPTFRPSVPEIRIPLALASLHTAHTRPDAPSTVTGNHKEYRSKERF